LVELTALPQTLYLHLRGPYNEGKGGKRKGREGKDRKGGEGRERNGRASHTAAALGLAIPIGPAVLELSMLKCVFSFTPRDPSR